MNRERRQLKGDAEVRRTEKEGEGRTRDKKEDMHTVEGGRRKTGEGRCRLEKGKKRRWCRLEKEREERRENRE